MPWLLPNTSKNAEVGQYIDGQKIDANPSNWLLPQRCQYLQHEWDVSWQASFPCYWSTWMKSYLKTPLWTEKRIILLSFVMNAPLLIFKLLVVRIIFCLINTIYEVNEINYISANYLLNVSLSFFLYSSFIFLENILGLATLYFFLPSFVSIFSFLFIFSFRNADTQL